MREHNLHSNRKASSRDIATRFAVFEQMKLLNTSTKYESITIASYVAMNYLGYLYCSVGAGLRDLFSCPEVQQYLYGTPMRELASDKVIYLHGSLRKVKNIISGPLALRLKYVSCRTFLWFPKWGRLKKYQNIHSHLCTLKKLSSLTQCINIQR